MKVFKGSQFFGMSSYTFENFLAEKYESSALKCRVGRLNTMPEKIFTFKSEIYMEKHQNDLGSDILDSQLDFLPHISRQNMTRGGGVYGFIVF